MSEKRFEVVLNEFDEVEYIMDKVGMEDRDFADFMIFVEELEKENRQLRNSITRLEEEIKRLEKIIWKIQWRFQQEVGIEKAKEHYKEIDKEMNV